MGSIPIARSQATPGQVGLSDWRQHINPMGTSWEFDAHRAVVESPHVSLHCPRITRTVTRSSSQVAGLGPKRTAASVRLPLVDLDLTETTIGIREISIPYQRSDSAKC